MDIVWAVDKGKGRQNAQLVMDIDARSIGSHLHKAAETDLREDLQQAALRHSTRDVRKPQRALLEGRAASVLRLVHIDAGLEVKDRLRAEGMHPLTHERLELLSAGKLAIHGRIARRKAVGICGLKLVPPSPARSKAVILAQVVV